MVREFMIGICQKQEVDTCEEKDRNSLSDIRRTHQIENAGLPGHPLREPAVERCCGPKGAREIGESA